MIRETQKKKKKNQHHVIKISHSFLIARTDFELYNSITELFKELYYFFIIKRYIGKFKESYCYKNTLKCDTLGPIS